MRDDMDYVAMTGATGSQGPFGPQGPAGDDATLTVEEEEGTPVTGGPHSIQDFVGSTVTVTNAGAGRATVTISSGSVFGTEQSYAEDVTDTLTQSTSYVDKVALTTGSLVGGDYDITWSTDWRHSGDTGSFGDMRVILDGTTTLAEVHYKPKDGLIWITFAGNKVRTLSAGVHTVDMQYSSTSSNKKTYSRNASVKLFRLS